MQTKTRTILTVVVMLACFTAMTAGCGDTDSPGSAGKVELLTEKDKLDYSIGYTIGTQIKMSLEQGKIEVNDVIFMQAIKDVLNDTPALSDEEVESRVMAFQKDQQAKFESEVKDNLDAAHAFYNENKTKPGIVTLPDSLQYEVLVKGDGPVPKASDTIKAHYRGTLLDGTEFDSSYNRGEPLEFNPGMVIKGWTEALTMMPVGSKWKVFIPPHLAYGEIARPNIPANSLLIFEIELLEIVE